MAPWSGDDILSASSNSLRVQFQRSVMLEDTPSELAKQYSVAVAASSGCVAVY